MKDRYLINNIENDLPMIEKVLLDRQLSGVGEIVTVYEEKLAKYFGKKYAVALSSGSAAIHCALAALNIQIGDEVIIPPSAPLMTVYPLLCMHVKVVFCDISKNDFGYDLEMLRKKINAKTKAVITVPMWGYPMDMDSIKSICLERNVPLIEDAAQAHGTLYNNKFMGTIGEIGCFSTHDMKLLSTGEGGFILTDNEEYYKKVINFSRFGKNNGVDLGINYKLSSLQAAIGVSRIDCIKIQVEKRTYNARYIKERIKNKNLKELSYVTNGIPNYYMLLMVCDGKFKNRAIALSQQLKSFGIPSDVLRYNFKPLYKFDILKEFNCDCPNCEELAHNLLTICVHPGLSKEELNLIVDKINTLE